MIIADRSSEPSLPASLSKTGATVAAALLGVTIILGVALRYVNHLSSRLAGASDESLLLTVLGLTLLVGGLADQVKVSAAIGAFLGGWPSPVRSYTAPAS